MNLNNLRAYHELEFEKLGIKVSNKPYEKCVEEVLFIVNALLKKEKDREEDLFHKELYNVQTYRRN